MASQHPRTYEESKAQTLRILRSNGFHAMAGGNVGSEAGPGYNQSVRTLSTNSHLPVCWLQCLVCPRRHLAVLPSHSRPSLFGSD